MRRTLILWCCFLLLPALAYAGLVRDDFTDGNDDGWEVINGDWEVAEETYVQLGLEGDFVQLASTIIQSPWEFSAGAIEVTILYDEGSDGAEIPAILYRLTDERNGYAFRLGSDRLEIGRYVDGTYDNIRGDAFPIDIAEPVVIKLDVDGIFTKVYYNGVLKSRIGDPNGKGTEKGRIGLAVFDPSAPISFDNVIIEGPGVFPFAAISQAVDPDEKLSIAWGQIKEDQ